MRFVNIHSFSLYICIRQEHIFLLSFNIEQSNHHLFSLVEKSHYFLHICTLQATGYFTRISLSGKESAMQDMDDDGDKLDLNEELSWRNLISQISDTFKINLRTDRILREKNLNICKINCTLSYRKTLPDDINCRQHRKTTHDSCINKIIVFKQIIKKWERKMSSFLRWICLSIQ